MLPAFPVCELLIAPVLAFAPVLVEAAFAELDFAAPDALGDPASAELLLLRGSPMTSICAPTCMRRSAVFPARWYTVPVCSSVSVYSPLVGEPPKHPRSEV